MENYILYEKDDLRKLVYEYKNAVDMLGLADIITIEEHRERYSWIKEWEDLLSE